ncbi:transmembrane 9 superfamily member 3 [Copidosoma floridanum]|nr:transmembrane 9 superfamily member 3 [Copidosoma floridanum]
MCRTWRIRLGFLVACLVLLSTTSHADEHNHIYDERDEVVLWMSTVGPYHNRQETYSYYSLPFCKGPKEVISHYHETLSEALEGIELKMSGIDIEFLVPVPKQKYCSVKLDATKYKDFVYAINNQYWYQMYMDDLPIWGVVGKPDDRNPDTYYIWTHKRLDIGYNGKQIIDVNLTSESKVELKPGKTIPFTYEVIWKKTNTLFKDRFDKYLDPYFFQHRIHWFSIFNSFMMVIFLVGLVSMILMRTLRKDYARYSKDEEMDDMERDLGDEYGWKQVHGDVFRPANHPILFSALIGAGYQITAVVLFVIIFAIVGELYTERGSMLSAAILLYAITSPINGYAGGSLYARMGGRVWIKQMLLSAFMLPVLVCGTAFFINFIAIYYASRAIPFGSMVAVTCICIFVILPLTLVGTVFGRNLSGTPDAPCRVNAVPRPIPEKKWFMEPMIIIMLGGILPFGSIFIEMYFIFTSFWAYKIYYVYGFMLLVFIILMIVTVCVTIVCTYFLLNAEDYRWQWTSFLAAASTAGYVYLYSFYYFFFKTKMYGLFQTTFYFGYMAIFSLALGIMCGTVGYTGTSAFVRKIYSTVKID